MSGLTWVYFDDNEQSNTEYKDRVSVEESYFKYDKIPTFPFEQEYFEISQDGFIIYAVAKDGTFGGESVSQQVTKLKPNTKDMMMSSTDNIVSFDLGYWYQNEGWEIISTRCKYISDKIFVDGNLMVKFGIVSRSKDDLFQSTVVYKYYFCPLEDKKIYLEKAEELTAKQN